MEKDKESYDEDDDLLNFDLDDLTPEDVDEEDIIELTDRIDIKEEVKSDPKQKETPFISEDDKETAEIIKVKKGSGQVDEQAETLTDVDISVLSEGEPIKKEKGGHKEISDEADMFEEDFSKIFDEEDSTIGLERRIESEDAIGQLISEIELDDNPAAYSDTGSDKIIGEDFDEVDLAEILEDETTQEIDLERLDGSDDSLLEVIEKVNDNELTETITHLQVDEQVMDMNLEDEGGRAEFEESSVQESEEIVSGSESPGEPIPGISKSKIEEIIRSVIQDTVERVVREAVTEVAERVISESIEALKQSLEIKTD